MRQLTDYRDTPPRASTLIESMRDVGYGLETALADIVDNSLSAGARVVRISVDTTAEARCIAIADDGRGLAEAELIEAMRLGSKNPLEHRAASDLGRFGLGLKTASFSQCRRLTVVSRQPSGTIGARWDLDKIAESDEWSLEILKEFQDVPFIDTLPPSGTLVVWQKLDRTGGNGTSAASHKAFVHVVDEARSHLELVFHRFLTSESRATRVSMTLNEVPLKGFDPFHSAHTSTIQGAAETIHIANQDVTVTPFTLPHHRNVTQKDWEHYAGKAGYLRNQGFYLYRAKRLIVYGTWFGLIRQTELTRLARVRIDIPNGMDSEWQIDIKKASARPPHEVRERLGAIIEVLGGPAKRVYERRGVRLGSSKVSVWKRMQIDQRIVYAVDSESPLVTSILDALPTEHRKDVLDLLQSVGAGLPMDALFADLASTPEAVESESLDEDLLRRLLASAVSFLRTGGKSKQDVGLALRAVEPFHSEWERCEPILEDLLSEV